MTTPESKQGPYEVFRVADYRRMLSTQFLASVCQQMQAVAVGWFIYDRTGSALSLALIGLSQIVPVLLLFLPAGQLADRYDRRSILTVTLTLSVLTSGCLALVSYLAVPVGWTYLACAMGAAANTILRPTRAAIVPAMVPTPLLSNALAWNSTFGQVAAIVGPSAAGLIIAASGNAFAVFAANCVLQVISLLLSMRLNRYPSSGKSERTLRHLFGGIAHVWTTQVILATISLDLLAVLFGGATALLPIYAKDILKVGPSGLGWLTAAPAVGACIVGALQGHLPPSKRAGVVFFWAVAGFGIATVVFGLSTWFPLSLLALAVIGGTDNISVVTRSTVVQLYTPDELRGRVSSVNNVFISSSNELGAFESGAVASITGPVFAVVSGGIATVLLVMAGLRVFPDLRKMRSLIERA